MKRKYHKDIGLLAKATGLHPNTVSRKLRAASEGTNELDGILLGAVLQLNKKRENEKMENRGIKLKRKYKKDIVLLAKVTGLHRNTVSRKLREADEEIRELSGSLLKAVKQLAIEREKEINEKLEKYDTD